MEKKNKKNKKDKKAKKEKNKKDKQDKKDKKSETIQITDPPKVLIQVSKAAELSTALHNLKPFQFSPDFQYNRYSAKNRLELPSLLSDATLHLFFDALDQAKTFTFLELGRIPGPNFNEIVCTRLLNNKTITTLSAALDMAQDQRDAVLRIIRGNSNVKRLVLKDRFVEQFSATDLQNRPISLRALVEAAKTLPHQRLTLSLYRICKLDEDQAQRMIPLIIDGINAAVIDQKTVQNNEWLQPVLLRALYERKLSMTCLNLSWITAAELDCAIDIINRDRLHSLVLRFKCIRPILPQLAAALKDCSRLRELTWELAERPFFEVYEYHSNLEQLSISGGDYAPTRLLQALLHRNPNLHTLGLPNQPLTMAQWRIIGDIISKYGTLSTLNLRLVPKEGYASEYLKILDLEHGSTITSLTIEQPISSMEMRLNAQQYLEQALRTNRYLQYVEYSVGDSIVSAEMQTKIAQNRHLLITHAKMFVQMMTMRPNIYFSILPLDCWLLVFKKVTLPGLRLDEYLLTLLNKS